ncbi:hypothetical protein AGMMS50256_36220 [Betaproteobacteria bacterium]|nr:hypothetical protein AGMMS50256_36220 [Betaproteobacteria bacterium]
MKTASIPYESRVSQKIFSSDLFPETLLVSREGERIFTDSLKIAECFGRHHRDVLKLIRNVMEQSPEEERLRNFAQRLDVYLVNNARRERPVFELTHDGFAIIAMSFTGEKAMRWKWDFLAAFRAMERQLADYRQREADELKARDRQYVRVLPRIKPNLIPVVEMTKKGMGRARIAATLDKSPASVTYHRRQARRFGLLAA